MYVSDLKVRPDHRGGVVADALSRWARDVCVATGGEDVPTFLAVLAGNRQMQRRLPGPRGLPRLHPVATVRSSAISLLWRRRRPDQGLRVAPAGPEDVEEMADLWRRVAPRRHLAHVHDARSLAGWVEAAPGLELSAYRLARRPDGRLAGFLGLWDQEPFKQLRVTSYSRRLAAARWAFNALAPSVRATPLPRPGRALRHVTAVHLCVPPEEPGVLRSLVLHAYDELRGRGYSFLLVGLDRSDPLAAALRGLLGQPTDVSLCLATPAGRDPPVLDARPIHHEIALV